MDCQIEGRSREVRKGYNPLSYRIGHLTVGQQKNAFNKAQEFLQSVMMDPESPTFLKDLIRSQNSVGLIGLELLLAAYVENELKDMSA